MSWNYTMADLFRDHGNPGVKLLQQPEEFKILLALYQAARPKFAIEIGQGTGASLYYWLKEAVDGARVLAVDVDHRELYEAMKKWPRMEHVGLNIVTARSDSTEALSAARKMGRVDFLFIDGSHAEADVRRDWELYSQLMAAGSIAAFHDIHLGLDQIREGWGTAKVWNEVKSKFQPGRVMEIVSQFSGSVGSFGIGVLFL